MFRTKLVARRLSFFAARSGRFLALAAPILASQISSVPGARAAITGIERVATSLNAPVFVTHAPNDRPRLFIVERGGGIRILNLSSGTGTTTEFLTIPGIDTEGEGGLLGLAFHPNFASNGKFYTYSTHDNGGVNSNGAISALSTRIREYTSVGTLPVDNTAFTTLMDFPRPQANHVSGWIGFDPTSSEANLYIASGDGGEANDTSAAGGHTPGIGNAQDITDNWMGKILRINVDSDAFPGDPVRNYAIPSSNPFTAGKPNEEGDDEIWAYGLRNPYRDSFDRATGDLFIGDVGQGAREEIDYQPAGVGGANYGWRLREGLEITNGVVGGAKPPDNVDPVYDYGRTGTFGGKSVFGGYVYRGPDPTLQGTYFFGDSGDFGNGATNKYWTFNTATIPPVYGFPEVVATDIKPLLTPNVGTPRFPVSYGEDAIGNLYIVYYETGQVYRIVTNAFRPGDFDGDADVDGDDLTRWTTGFGTATGATRTMGDANGDGAVDGDDLLVWQQNVGWSPLNAASPANSPVPEPSSAAILAVASIALVRRGARRRTSAVQSSKA